jgi:hypothetical protein
MSHSSHDSLINRFLDARGLLQDTRSALAGFADGDREPAPDTESLRTLYREIDAYLASLGAFAGAAAEPSGGAPDAHVPQA